MTTHKFRLYWRRETGCDAGTPVSLEDLDVAIRPRILELMNGESANKIAGEAETITVRLPFLDRREWRRRSESLRATKLEREGSVIYCVPPSATAALREQAAETIATHPAWLAAPPERARSYFRVWQSVSVALQEYLRRATVEFYFRDPARFEDRKRAWPLLVYAAMRPFRGVARTEFTYDIAHAGTLEAALSMIHRPFQDILARTQQHIEASGREELSRRYAPLWCEDILRAVEEDPRRLLAVLGDEAALVDAVITLGASRNLSMVKPFARQVMTTLRSFYDADMRGLAAPLLSAATEGLERALLQRSTLEQKRLEQKRQECGLARGEPMETIPGRVTSRSPRGAICRAFAAQGTSGHCTPESAAYR